MFGYRNGPKIVATVSATNKILPTTASTLQILAITFLRSSAASRSYEYAGAHTMNARPDTISETMIVPQMNPFALWTTVYHVASFTSVGYISVTLSTVICRTSANFCNSSIVVPPMCYFYIFSLGHGAYAPLWVLALGSYADAKKSVKNKNHSANGLTVNRSEE